jgi:excisionase family DNA binding protein
MNANSHESSRRGAGSGERLLSAREVGERLGIKPRTVSLWVRQGRLPAYRVGRYLRFDWDEVTRALEATCRVGGES